MKRRKKKLPRWNGTPELWWWPDADEIYIVEHRHPDKSADGSPVYIGSDFGWYGEFVDEATIWRDWRHSEGAVFLGSLQ